MIAILDAALNYARLGIPVFPVWSAAPFRDGGFVCGCGRLKCDSPAKHPLARAVPHGLKDASRDEVRVRSFFTNYPDANIGAATGDLVAIDIDPHHGGNVAELERLYGPLPHTWRAKTGGGGEHIFFKTDAAIGIGNSRGKLAKGVDVRGVGGFVVLPPSLHVSGQRYKWWNDHYPPYSSLALLPASIVGALAEPPPTAEARNWSEFAASEITEGGRNDAISRFAGHLLRRYVDPRVALQLLIAWNQTHCKPPLDQREVVKTVNSIAGIELRRRS